MGDVDTPIKGRVRRLRLAGRIDGEEEILKNLLALNLEKGCLKERPPGLKSR